MGADPVAATGKNMDELWAEYRNWLTARFSPKVASARQGEVVAQGWSITSPALTPDGTRWYIRGSGYTLPTLVRQAPGGKPQALREVELDARLSASPGGSLLLASRRSAATTTTTTTSIGSARRQPEAPHPMRPLPPGGAARRRSAPSRSASEAGSSQVVTLDGEVLYRAAAGESITGVAAGGTSVFVTRLRAGTWSLIRISGQKTEVLLSDSAIKHSPRLDDAGEVFFIADYGKIFNVWSLRGGRLARWTEAAHRRARDERAARRRALADHDRSGRRRAARLPAA